MAINLNLPTMMGTPYTTEADKLISDIRSFEAPNIPTPPPTIPKLTGFGDKLARIGGFGDEPGELKTKEELEKMTQAEIDAYVRQRKQARRLGASEALIQFGEALQGKPAAQNALAREQARKNIELQNQYQKDYENAIRLAEQTNPQQARLLRSLGLPGYINLQQKRAEEYFLGSGEEKTAFMNNMNYLMDLGYTFEQASNILKQGTTVQIDQGKKVFEQEAAKAAFATKKTIDEQIEQDRQLLTRIKMSKQQLLDGVKTGKLEEFLMPFKQFAVSIGAADKATIDQLGQQELFEATTNYLVPRMRVTGSGSTSDMEINLFRSAVPNLGRTPAGNLVIAGGIENLVEYNIKRQRLMDKYLAENQNLLGFGDYADKELGPMYKSYTSDNDFDMQVKQGKLKAGDFVYDAINRQFRVLTQEDVL